MVRQMLSMVAGLLEVRIESFTFWHYMGNKMLTLMSNMFSNLNLTDMETCYKMFRRDILELFELKSNRFGFEPEFTAKIAKANLVIYELPISYYGRTYDDGKKITWKDGFAAIFHILRYNLTQNPLSIFIHFIILHIFYCKAFIIKWTVSIHLRRACPFV